MNVGALLSCKTFRLKVLTNWENDLNKTNQTSKTDWHDRQPKRAKWILLETSIKRKKPYRIKPKKWRAQACLAVVNLLLWARLCWNRSYFPFPLESLKWPLQQACNLSTPALVGQKYFPWIKVPSPTETMLYRLNCGFRSYCIDIIFSNLSEIKIFRFFFWGGWFFFWGGVSVTAIASLKNVCFGNLPAFTCVKQKDHRTRWSVLWKVEYEILSKFGIKKICIRTYFFRFLFCFVFYHISLVPDLK